MLDRSWSQAASQYCCQLISNMPVAVKHVKVRITACALLSAGYPRVAVDIPAVTSCTVGWDLLLGCLYCTQAAADSGAVQICP